MTTKPKTTARIRAGLAALTASAALIGCASDNDGAHTGSGGASQNQAGLGGSSAGTSGGSTAEGSGGSATDIGGASSGIGGSVTATGGSAAATGGMSGYWQNGTQGQALDSANDDRLWGATFGPNNEIYAVGYVALPSGDRQMAVAKYTPQGTLDAAFGTGGVTLVNASPYAGSPDDPVTEASDADASIEEARDVVVQSDGKLVVVGRAESPLESAPTRSTLADLVFFRLNPDGSRDVTFGDEALNGTPLDGLAIVSFGTTPEDQVWGLEVDATDRVYAFGSGLAQDATRTDADRYIVRLTADGVLDTSFGAAGFATFDVPQSSLTGASPTTLKLNDNQRHGVILPDGSILSSGYTNVAGRNQVVMAKFTSSGLLDPSFSGDGIARVSPFANGFAEAYGVAVQYDAGTPTGFVTTGYGRTDVDSTTDTDVDLVSFRFKPNGEYDTSWSMGGGFVFDLTGAEDRGRHTLALPDNRILMIGTATATGTNKDALLLLLEANGSPSKTFDAAGQKLYDFGSTSDEFFSAALSRDNAWLVAVGYAAATSGGSSNGNSTFVILPVSK